MADLLNTGVSALLGYRKAIDTAGHNIANVNTDGYSRQRVDFVSRLGAPQGDGYIGSGVSASTVKRITDSFIGSRIIADASAHGRAASFEHIVGQLDTWLSDAATGLAVPMNRFFGSLGDFAADPASTANRQSVLADAESLAARFDSLQGRLDSLQAEVNSRLRQSVQEINDGGQSIALLNERIALATGAAGGQPPNDLLDQRDRLLQELAAQVGISTTVTDDGAVNVFTGSGQALVLGSRATPLGVSDDPFGSGSLEITYAGVPVTRQLGGGVVGGLLDAQRETLQPAASRLGRIAVAMASAFNAQQALGVDANGQAGAPLFAPITGSAFAASGNSGSAGITIGFGDPAQLGDAQYELRYNGTSWQLSDAATGASVAMSGSGTAADPFVAQGLRITLDGSPAAGDRFLLSPTARAAGDLRVALTDPAHLAAAAPGSGANSSDNSNARALLALGDQRLLDGGLNTFHSAQVALTAGVGNQAQQASVVLASQERLLSQSMAARDATSGVNLDEEASNLVRFQQAYQAAAQVISVADTVFQSLLSAVRR